MQQNKKRFAQKKTAEPPKQFRQSTGVSWSVKNYPFLRKII